MKIIKSLLATTLITTLGLTQVADAAPTKQSKQSAPKTVLFSKYIEGSKFNKAIEVSNNTDRTINLKDYTIELYKNGNKQPANTFHFKAKLQPKQTFTISHTDATSKLRKMADVKYDGITEFNGNDALILKKDGKVVDSLGQIGSNKMWGDNRTLIREHNVALGDTNTKDAVTLKGWQSFPIDTFKQGQKPSKKQPKTTAIHDIQGTGHTSPLKDQHVNNVSGIVTYQYEVKGNHYFHLQAPDNEADNNPNTSEAIVVYAGKDKPKVNVGDKVMVNGLVKEYAIEGYEGRENTDLPVTEIDARSDVSGQIDVKATKQDLPKPYVIDRVPSKISANDDFKTFDRKHYAIDFWESLEGMRVQTGDVRSVGPLSHGEIFTVLDDVAEETKNGGILLKKNNAHGERIPFKLADMKAAKDFDVLTGDQFKGPLVGYVNYGFQNYKVHVDTQAMKDAHQGSTTKPKATSIKPSEKKLTIASYNLENFSNDKKTSTDDKAQKLAKGIVKNMKNPDIVGVTEVQDNNGPNKGDAKSNESYERLISNIERVGGPKYKYVNIDPENNKDGGQPESNIRVGFLYNPERVKLKEGMKAGDATTAVAYKNGKLTLNPGRIAPNDEAFIESRKPLAAQFEFKGKDVVAIINHWNSKRGDDGLFGQKQPPFQASEVQRLKEANVVNEFVKSIKRDNPTANVVAMGDFNDFQWSKSLKTLEKGPMTNLVNDVPKASRYSYVYQGNTQTLDHFFVSDNMEKRAKLDMIHVNADFTDLNGRASDHDPLLAQVVLRK